MENKLDPNQHEDKSENENLQPESFSNNEELPLITRSDADDDEFDEEENYEIEDDYDPMDEYGKSGEKYGWYNGFSDDAIDDAFEGDPTNTWNVD